MIVTEELLRLAASEMGGYSKAQIKLAQEVFPGRWKSQMLGRNVKDEFWSKFVAARRGKKNAKSKKSSTELINKVSPNKKDDWSWQPEKKDVPQAKVKSSKKNKNRGKNKKKRARVSRSDNNEFYTSKEWRELRVRVLEKYECKCMMCGRSPRLHGIVIHVDHIKPRSKHPELSLAFDNLQILCEDCNLGKSNKYQTDWRPDDPIAEELDMMALNSSPL